MTPQLSIFIIGTSDFFTAEDFPVTRLSAFPSTEQLKTIAENIRTPYLLIHTGTPSVTLGQYALERMCRVADMCGAGLLYSDYYKTENGISRPHPTIDYQTGSLRDDFDFGPLLLFRSSSFKEATGRMEHNYRYASLYDLRLKISETSPIVRLPEFLYTVTETDFRKSGEKQFDYVDPKNRNVQLEMEQACTGHLKAIGAWLPPVSRQTDLSAGFPVEASVIIPVKNRVKTIDDAIRSVLGQETGFRYNIIVVDNHSDDGTTELLQQLSAQHPELIHYIPPRHDLGIGGCWNEAVMHPSCGKFAVQLDSDDLYIDSRVLETIVRNFYAQNCAMLVGSYRMVNFKLEEIPPGIIDHREWTPENGHNNALRINGLGAPRAFYTPVIRELKFPNVSYGEDYAVGLAISGGYRIGRIYEPLYLCRRWDENSDASLDIQRLNTYNSYKDKLRTLEIAKRISGNRKQD